MKPDINTRKFVAGSALTAEQKLQIKDILVELLSGQGVPGRRIPRVCDRRIRLTTQP